MRMPLLSEAFGLVRVIHLPDRKDRFREVSAQLGALGMQFGVGGVELYEATRPADAAGFPSLGSHGCFLSHLEILRDARDRGVESVLVVEDDFEVPAEELQGIGSLAAALRERVWGFAYLGHIEELPVLAPGAVPDFCEYAGPVRQAHLFAVHGDVLSGLVAYLEGCLVRPPGDPVGGPMDVDGAYTMYRAAHPEVVTLLARPSMAVQRSSRSDIRFRTAETIPGVREAFSVARRVRRAFKGR